MDKPAATPAPAPVTFPVETDGQIVPITFRTVVVTPHDKGRACGPRP